MKRKEATFFAHKHRGACTHTCTCTGGTKASRWQHFQPTSSRTNGMALAALRCSVAASAIPLRSTNNIYLSFTPWQFGPLETFGMPHQMMPMFPFAGFVLCAQKLRGTFIFGITQSLSFFPTSRACWEACWWGLFVPSCWANGVSIFGLILSQRRCTELLETRRKAFWF